MKLGCLLENPSLMGGLVCKDPECINRDLCGQEGGETMVFKCCSARRHFKLHYRVEKTIMIKYCEYHCILMVKCENTILMGPAMVSSSLWQCSEQTSESPPELHGVSWSNHSVHKHFLEEPAGNDRVNILRPKLHNLQVYNLTKW